MVKTAVHSDGCPTLGETLGMRRRCYSLGRIETLEGHCRRCCLKAHSRGQHLRNSQNNVTSDSKLTKVVSKLVSCS